jgi:hypothetical protein
LNFARCISPESFSDCGGLGLQTRKFTVVDEWQIRLIGGNLSLPVGEKIS